MYGGEELQRLRMIRKRGMHHIYSFFPPAISGGDAGVVHGWRGHGLLPGHPARLAVLPEF